MKNPQHGRNTPWVKGITSMALVLALTACNDGSSSSTDTIDSTPPGDDNGDSTTTTTLQLGGGSLLVVPPSQPDALKDIDPDADANLIENPAFFPVTVVDGEIATSGSQGLHPAEAVYARGTGDDQGKLYRVSTGTADFSGLAPQRISSETDADKTCLQASDLPGGDFTDLNNTPIVYATREATQNCDDDISLSWKLVFLGDDATTDPRSFPEPDAQTAPNGESLPPVTTLRGTDGTFAGWLIEQNGKLVRLDSDGQVTNGDVADVAEFFEFLTLLADDTVLLNIDGALVGVNIADNSVIDYNYTFPGQPTSGTTPPRPYAVSSDNESLFFLVKDAPDSAQLYRTTADAGVVKIDENTDSSNIIGPDSLSVGATHVAWVDRTTTSTDVVRSADKAAIDLSSGQQLHELASTRFRGAISDQWMFYQDGSFTAGDAYATRLDGSVEPVTFTDAQWVGYSLASNRSIGGAAAPASRVYLVNDFSQVSGQALISVAADAPENRDGDLDLGIIPAAIDQLIPTTGFGPERIIGGVDLGDEESANNDLLFLNDTAPGSLQQLTDTDDKDEYPLLLF